MLAMARYGAKDMERAKQFYNAITETIGAQCVGDYGEVAVYKGPTGGMFIIGKPFAGDPTPGNGTQVVCMGANVLHENDQPETCNNKDDDCDGVIDDSPANVGDACGASNLAPCKFGKLACQSGGLVCVGALNPSPETCDGIDNDCDGMIDFTMATNKPPADSIGACNVPPAPPAGASTPTTSRRGGTSRATLVSRSLVPVSMIRPAASNAQPVTSPTAPRRRISASSSAEMKPSRWSGALSSMRPTPTSVTSAAWPSSITRITGSSRSSWSRWSRVGTTTGSGIG